MRVRVLLRVWGPDGQLRWSDTRVISCAVHDGVLYSAEEVETIPGREGDILTMVPMAVVAG